MYLLNHKSKHLSPLCKLVRAAGTCSTATCTVLRMAFVFIVPLLLFSFVLEIQTVKGMLYITFCFLKSSSPWIIFKIGKGIRCSKIRYSCRNLKISKFIRT